MVDLNELSKVGLGTYRMSIKNKNNIQALNLATKYGCNLIDTSSNYQYGESEELIGKYIRENPRKDLFVISKAGYITYKDAHIINRLNKSGSKAAREIIHVNTTTHCIHPDFLKLQMKKSLQRLGRKKVDGFLIHNPEYFLKSTLTKNSKEIYYRRIKESFEFLEDAVSKGLISYYGVSSNTFSSINNPTSTSLHRLLTISKEVDSRNHFKLIQFPFNFFEQQALEEKKQGQSIISLAMKNGLVTLGNRPLNCYTSFGFIRLAQYAPMKQKEINESEKVYDKFISLIRIKLTENEVYNDPFEFEIIQYLRTHWKCMPSHSAVDLLFTEHLNPFLNALYGYTVIEDDFIGSAMKANEKKILVDFYKYCRKYSTQMMSAECFKALKFLKENQQFPDSHESKIPAIACDHYLKKGVNHVLVGMTKSEYVKELKDFFVTDIS